MRIQWIEEFMEEAVELIVAGGESLERGVTVLDGLLYDEPGYGRLHNHLGWAHLYYTFDLAKAEVHLKAAIRFQEDYQAPYLHLGTLYVRQQKYGAAIDILDQGLMKPEANKAAMYELIGQAYEMRRDYASALRAYYQAMHSTFVSHEVNMYSESMKRCRKKRWSAMLSFL